MKQFAEHAGDIAALEYIKYACYTLRMKEPIKDPTRILHVLKEFDRIRSLGNYGTPKQFLYMFHKLHNYVKGRGAKPAIGFKWTFENGILFNLRSAMLLAVYKCRLAADSYKEV